MIVLVCGGRDYRDRRRVFEFLDAVHDLAGPITLIRHGDARGADTLADEWAAARGVPRDPHPANWYPQPGRLDRSAGFARNARMAKLPMDLCIAFPGGNGTADMARRAEAVGILTLRL